MNPEYVFDRFVFVPMYANTVIQISKHITIVVKQCPSSLNEFLNDYFSCLL